MVATIDEVLPTAKDVMEKLAAARLEESKKEAQREARLAAERKAQLDQLRAPSGVSEEDAIRRAVLKIERAVSNGLVEVQIYRFPNQLCTDCGRAINQQEAGWPDTLTGVPLEMYLLWHRHFRERGYKLRAEIVGFPNGMPGDVAMTLRWG
jgi:hypothetical protein